jgi:hypothetical protein
VLPALSAFRRHKRHCAIQVLPLAAYLDVFGHHLLQVAHAQRVSHIPPHAKDQLHFGKMSAWILLLHP